MHYVNDNINIPYSTIVRSVNDNINITVQE